VDGRGGKDSGVVVLDADFAGEHGDKYRTAVREAFCHPTLAAKAAAKVGHPAFSLGIPFYGTRSVFAFPEIPKRCTLLFGLAKRRPQ
jgi:hypothetical protein